MAPYLLTTFEPTYPTTTPADVPHLPGAGPEGGREGGRVVARERVENRRHEGERGRREPRARPLLVQAHEALEPLVESRVVLKLERFTSICIHLYRSTTPLFTPRRVVCLPILGADPKLDAA